VCEYRLGGIGVGGVDILGAMLICDGNTYKFLDVMPMIAIKFPSLTYAVRLSRTTVPVITTIQAKSFSFSGVVIQNIVAP
jgi:hypothetical protein